MDKVADVRDSAVRPGVRIPICQPSMSGKEEAYVLEALRENELSGHGRHIKEFEERFAAYIGVKHAAFVPNGTIALNLALASMGVGIGDFVIIPSQTISCCAFAATSLGARIIVTDVDADTWCMDINHLEKALSLAANSPGYNESSKVVVMPVHVYGGVPCDMNRMSNLRPKFRFGVIEDVCEALGSEYRYEGNIRRLGSIGNAGCFSFFANKTLQTGEGGMITTDDPVLIGKIRYLRNNAYGVDPETKFWAQDQGFNYRPHNLAAAIGLGQMDRINELTDKRTTINCIYRDKLNSVHGKFTFQEYWTKDCSPVPWMTVVLVPRNEEGESIRGEFMKHMMEKGIETRPTFPPLSQHPYLKKFDVQSTGESISQYIWENGVILPSGGDSLTVEVVEEVCYEANKFLERV